jgi:carbamoylphosphate synthase large subunit
MKKYLLYHRKSFRTARSLARLLKIRYNRDALNIYRRGHYPIIRYGNSEGDFGINETNMNSKELISLCANSYYFGKWAKENNFWVPYYSKFNWNSIPEYPFLLRKLNHIAGTDIIIVNNERDLMRIPRRMLSERYTVKFVPTTFELRVHIINGEIVRVFKKVKKGHLENEEYIRTSRRGFHYSLILPETRENKYIKAQQLCLDVADKLGLFFGGVDIAWCKEKSEYIIWEINTAPGLNTETLRMYAERLRRFI